MGSQQCSERNAGRPLRQIASTSRIAPILKWKKPVLRDAQPVAVDKGRRFGREPLRVKLRPDRQITDHLVDEEEIHGADRGQDLEGIAQDTAHPVLPGIERALLPPEKDPRKVQHDYPFHEIPVGLQKSPHEAPVAAADLAEAAALSQNAFLPQPIAQDGPIGLHDSQCPEVRRAGIPQGLADGEFRHEIDGVVEVVMAGVVKGGHGGLTYFLSSRRARVYTNSYQQSSSSVK